MIQIRQILDLFCLIARLFHSACVYCHPPSATLKHPPRYAGRLHWHVGRCAVQSQQCSDLAWPLIFSCVKGVVLTVLTCRPVAALQRLAGSAMVAARKPAVLAMCRALRQHPGAPFCPILELFAWLTAGAQTTLEYGFCSRCLGMC